MKIKSDIICLSLTDLSQKGNASAQMLKAFRNNPWSASDNIIGRIAGYIDGREIGGEYVFPLRVRARETVIDVLAGSTLYVDERYRRSGLGMDLPELRWQHSPSRVALGAALSQMALPVHRLLDYVIFLLPRNIMLWRSRSLVETKLRGVQGRFAACILDCGIALYSLVLRMVCTCKLSGLKVDEVSVDDDATIELVSSLIVQDNSIFSEVHDAQWLRWHMSESFSKDGPLRMFVARRNGTIIGFYMIKKRFYKQASHRGFRNIWLGSVVEWQVEQSFKGKLGWFLVDAAIRLKKDGVDAVEIPTVDRPLNRFFRRIGWRQVGESNFVIKAGEESPLYGDVEMTKAENWRLRPAMGDAGLS